MSQLHASSAAASAQVQRVGCAACLPCAADAGRPAAAGSAPQAGRLRLAGLTWHRQLSSARAAQRKSGLADGLDARKLPGASRCSARPEVSPARLSTGWQAMETLPGLPWVGRGCCWASQLSSQLTARTTAQAPALAHCARALSCARPARPRCMAWPAGSPACQRARGQHATSKREGRTIVQRYVPLWQRLHGRVLPGRLPQGVQVRLHAERTDSAAGVYEVAHSALAEADLGQHEGHDAPVVDARGAGCLCVHCTSTHVGVTGTGRLCLCAGARRSGHPSPAVSTWQR